MININQKTYKDIEAKVGPEKMRQIERDCGITDIPPENPAGGTMPRGITNIVGAEHLAQSEREGIPVTDVIMSVFERQNLGKKIVFTEEQVVEDNKRQIIELHNQIREYMKISVDNAVKIGELLYEQKKRIRKGGFTRWVTENVPFTLRTAQNYMKIFYYKDELQAQHITSLCEAYALIGGEATPDEVVSTSDSTNIVNSGWSLTKSTVSLDGFELPKKHPTGIAEKLEIDRELINRMINGEYPFDGRKGKYLKMVVDISNSKKSMDPKLLGDFLYAAHDYLKAGGKLILHKRA